MRQFESERDYSGMRRIQTSSTCAPCSVGINVADINKYLNLALAQGEIPETVADHYKLLEHHASECVSCGSCVRNCPFSVEVIQRMKKAVDVFGY